MNFQTCARKVELEGVGLHSGVHVSLRIAPREETGWVFVRVDLPDAPEIPVDLANVTATKHATTLTFGSASVSTTEHLLAALWCAGITNARIELDGPEVPIVDGSAAPWNELLAEAGVRILSGARPVYELARPVWFEDGEASVLGLPHHELRLSTAVRYNREWLPMQTFDGVISADSFARELAAARTFTLEEWIDPLRAAGLIQGGSTDNAVVLHADAPSSPFRFDDEIARHKALDVLGDVALLFGQNGGELHAHLIAARAGHGSHRAWMQAALVSGALFAQSGRLEKQARWYN
jgi:UDP-3-O-[3-hydroxymyristoyl] N-acetylglucosamine deacetylase